MRPTVDKRKLLPRGKQDIGRAGRQRGGPGRARSQAAGDQPRTDKEMIQYLADRMKFLEGIVFRNDMKTEALAICLEAAGENGQIEFDEQLFCDAIKHCKEYVARQNQSRGAGQNGEFAGMTPTQILRQRFTEFYETYFEGEAGDGAEDGNGDEDGGELYLDEMSSL